MTSLRSQNGFTLVELITVMVLLTILSVITTQFIVMPMRSFADIAARGELVDQADIALQRMSRELRTALPNSIRISSSGTRTSLEYLNTTTGGRFRARMEVNGTGNPLTNGATDSFDVLGGINGVITPGPAGLANCLNGNSDCLVIYNTGTGVGAFNAYSGANAAAITAVSGNQITFNNGAGWSFPFPIPPTAQQRFFVVDQPVSYVCDLGTGELLRYAGYSINATQPLATFSVTGRRLAVNVVGCQFSYVNGAGARHGLVSIHLQLQNNAADVSLLHQVHVANVP
ncbi:MAG: prepilin-type N-terminal cleavage/methylation domain-containing protein [Gammaproteobacteria bacterium]|nr:prepilin-type N-terminal cleavage/methylation domain-containing protein [Gammaproteobacteria bacterium]